MRKIERLMKQAIRSRRDWRLANTCVDITDQGVIVRLHGHRIAQLIPDENILWVDDCG